MEKEKELAIYLHDKFCHDNHIDMCSWDYEINNGVHDWTRSEHQYQLEKAQELLQFVKELNEEKVVKKFKV